MPEPATLIVRHVPGSGFQVVRLRDGKTTAPVDVVSPVDFPVQDRPDSDLMRELQWYLETFLDYPFPPETDHAERVREALRLWGEQAFDALFGSREAGRLFDAATTADYARLLLQVSSDDPRVLSWPWEALHDPEVGHLAHTCQIERRLNKVRDPQPLPDRLPAERVNILLVTARPYDQDVRYRSISRPLVELIERQKLPAHVDVLRPPTLDALRDHLRQRPGYYHILHFDGHGAYGGNTSGPVGPHTLQGPQGRLIFEKEDGQPDPITADQLSVLLREHAVPAVVLNACQSAMLDERADDPFASVAAALVKSGMRSVVAMAYSLYVSGAQQCLPAFYQRLFEEGNIARAVRAGRQQMLAHKGRTCARGEFPLDDWLVPVLYQQDPLDFSFASRARASFVRRPSKLPAEVQQEQNPYGFVGRDGAILALERAMRRPPAGILIAGLGGVGKTTLARGFLQWLDATDGLGEGCFWFTFADIRSAEFVFNRMGEALFGPQFITLDIDAKVEHLAAVFREHRFVIVWDNFEVVRGIPGTAVTANLSDADRRLLSRFLDRLRGAPTKMILTSRSPEEWLGNQRRYLLPLRGLEGEERWDYCTAILHDLGLRIDRSDPDLVKLMGLLDGHPLAMRVMLPRLAERPASWLVEVLRSRLSDLDPDEDEAQARLYATLRFVQESLPTDLQPLLIPLALHEGFVQTGLLKDIAEKVDAQWTRARIDDLIETMVAAGLLREVWQTIFEMHPVLTGFLRTAHLPTVSYESRDAWAQSFVYIMGHVADRLTPLPLHEQRGAFYYNGVNFHHALSEAERLGMDDNIAALTQALASYAQNSSNYEAAASLFERLADHCRARGNQEGEAAALHHLGMIAAERRDFAAAEQWCRKLLAIKEKHGDEQGAGGTYHILGSIAEARRDFAVAEQWYRQALAILEKQGPEHYVASTYHQMGRIAEERRDFAAAEQWYRQALTIDEKQCNEHGAAVTYRHLGVIAAERRDFPAAEQWYRKAITIHEKHRNEHGAAGTYHHLGMIAEELRDFAAAEQWYYKALAITEKHGIDHYAASTYHQLGRIAVERRDFAVAEQWCRKAMTIWEKHGIEHYASHTYHLLGKIALERSDFAAAEQWCRKSLAIEEKHCDKHGAAVIYHQLGIAENWQGHFVESGQWLLKSLLAFTQIDEPNLSREVALNFLINFKSAPPADQAKLKAMWAEAGLGPFPGPEAEDTPAA